MKHFYFVSIICLALAAKSQTEGRAIDSLKSVYLHSREDTVKLSALNELVWPLYADSRPDSGVKYGLVALELAGKTHNERKEMVTWRRLGICYTILGNYKLGLKAHQQSLAIAEKLKDENSIGIAYGNIGVVYLDVGDFSHALEYNLKSIRLKLHAGNKVSINTNYYNIGLIHKNMGYYDEALRDMDSCIYYAKLLKDDRALGNGYNGKGMVYNAAHQPAKAKEYYLLAQEVNARSGNEYNMSGNFNSMGTLFFQQNQFDSARYYFEKCLDVSSRGQYASGIAFAFSNLSSVSSKLKDYKTAIDYSKSSIEADTLNLDNVGYCYGVIADAYRHLHDYKMALLYVDKQVKIKDSLDLVNKNKDLVRLQLQYDYDNKLTADSIRFSDQEKISMAKVEAADARLKQEKTFRYTLLLGLVGLLVFSYIIWSRLKLIRSQKNTIEHQKNEMEYQKGLVEEKQKEIVDSINYARRIQYTLLAQDELLKKHLPEFFILFKPKDIVSGDFYWAAKKDERFYLAVCDCTGHGVPGAFMSLLNISFLNEAVNQHNIKSPNEILEHVRKRLIESISQQGGQDGMDAVLVCFDLTNGRMTYSAANNKPVIVRDGELITLPADKMPVGKGEKDLPFTLFTMDARKGDRLYMYSDGYADQFGGAQGKKFKYKQLQELLAANAHLPMPEQVRKLDQAFEDWKTGHEQVDDVLVAGVNIQ